MVDESKYFQTGDYKLKALGIVNAKGTYIDLRPEYWQSFTIKESIYDPYISAKLVLMDVNNLASVFPIIGNEVITAVIKTNKFSDREISLTFVCVNTETKSLGGNSKTQAYELSLVSNTYISGIRGNFSKKYPVSKESDSISNIIREIIDEHIVDPRNVDISDTEGKFKFNIPFFTPYKAIDMMKRKAYVTRKTFVDSSFLFYENINGLNFKSLYEIKKQPEAKTINYNVRSTGFGTEVTENKFNSGELMEFHRTFNRMFEMIEGMYGAAITNYDLTSKTIESKIFTLEDLENSNTLNEHTLTPEYIKYLREGTNHTNIVNSQSFAYCSTPERNTPSDIKDNRKIFDLHVPRNIDMIRTRGNVITIRIPGDSDLSAGDTVYLEVPNLGVESADGKSKQDTLVSGKYIISKIDHNLTRTQYFCNLELVKDSVVEPLVSA